jgi:hypothetical protein
MRLFLFAGLGVALSLGIIASSPRSPPPETERGTRSQTLVQGEVEQSSLTEDRLWEIDEMWMLDNVCGPPRQRLIGLQYHSLDLPPFRHHSLDLPPFRPEGDESARELLKRLQQEQADSPAANQSTGGNSDGPAPKAIHQSVAPDSTQSSDEGLRP